MTTQTAMPKEVTAAIAKVMGAVGYVQKKGTNAFHNYKFAAIGDLLAKIQPAMVEAGLVITQSELRHELIAEGSVMTATYEFSLAHTSGAQWTDRPCHTGMAGARNSKGGFDDKALNKCHTAARKYFLLGLFQIPTGDVADPDEEEDKPARSNGHGQAPVSRQAEPRGEASAPPDSAVVAFLKGKNLTLPIPGARAGKPDLKAWAVSMGKAIDACPEIRVLDDLWGMNSGNLADLQKVDVQARVALEQKADERRASLTQPTFLAAE